MAKLRPKDLAKLADAAAIAESSTFTVNWFVGRSGNERGPIVRMSLWDRATFSAADYGSRELALSAARFAVIERGRGPDGLGRLGIIYAVTPSGMTVHVE